MEEAKVPMVELGPITFNLTLLAVCIVTILLIFGFVFWASRQMTLKPKGKQTALEYLISFVNGIGKSIWIVIFRSLIRFYFLPFFFLWQLPTTWAYLQS